MNGGISLINVVSVKKEEEDVLHNLMQFYIYEFSNYLSDITLRENGRYKPFDLSKYWDEARYHAFFIKKDQEYIGFALVENGEEMNVIEEFFIIAKCSGKGYGKEAATNLFHMFPGKWHITQIQNNYRAQSFWRGLIYELTGGQMIECYDENRKSVQEFHTDSIKR